MVACASSERSATRQGRPPAGTLGGCRVMRTRRRAHLPLRLCPRILSTTPPSWLPCARPRPRRTRRLLKQIAPESTRKPLCTVESTDPMWTSRECAPNTLHPHGKVGSLWSHTACRCPYILLPWPIPPFLLLSSSLFPAFCKTAPFHRVSLLLLFLIICLEPLVARTSIAHREKLQAHSGRHKERVMQYMGD